MFTHVSLSYSLIKIIVMNRYNRSQQLLVEYAGIFLDKFLGLWANLEKKSKFVCHFFCSFGCPFSTLGHRYTRFQLDAQIVIGF